MENLTNPIPDEHFYNVCKPGQGHECCRYVVASSAGIECAKHSSFRTLLDKRVLDENIVARGDNCEGVKDVKF